MAENVRYDSPDQDDPIMPPETLRERLRADGGLWRLGFAEGRASGIREAAEVLNAWATAAVPADTGTTETEEQL